jgi:hypothetical protein
MEPLVSSTTLRDPALAFAAGQDEVGAVSAAPRGTDKGAGPGRDGFEPALQGHFPGGAIKPAQGGDELVRGTVVDARPRPRIEPISLPRLSALAAAFFIASACAS